MSGGLTNWRVLISDALRAKSLSWDDVVSSTLTQEQETQVFDSGHGWAEGCAFTIWTKDYVLFPAMYDGAEWVGMVPRNPNGVATEHVGGG